MGGGYRGPQAGDSVDPIVNAIKDVRTQLRDVQRPPGTRLAGLVSQVQALVAQVQNALVNLTATVISVTTDYLSTGTVSMGSLSLSGSLTAVDVTASGTVTAADALSSPGAYLLDVTTLPGGRQTVWQHNSGLYGFAPSTVDVKTNMGPVTFTAADVLAVTPHVYQYKAQIAIREDAANQYYDPDYVVPWEIGLLAEDLIAHNMSCFVVFEADGTTAKTINYDVFAAVTTLVLAADFDARLRALESPTA